MRIISIIVPVYNEEKVIKNTIEQIQDNIKDIKEYKFEIIVVNDGSKDNSKRIIENLKNVIQINHIENKGYGASLKTGINNSNGEYILIIDADGTYPINKIKELTMYIKDYDMVVGSRTGKKVSIPFMRKPAKIFLTILANIVSGKKIPDLNSGFRIFRKDLALKFMNLYPQGFSFTTTITLAFLTNNFSVKYIPIDYHKRIGKSTIKPIKDFISFNYLIMRMILFFNPLKIFIPLSIVLMLAGILRGIRDFYIADSLGQLSVILVIFSIQILFLGAIAELINKRIGV